ncbi:uncharacterized protein A4U43_UnF3750 [Asparagus officinalis]|uniref:Uncharacterized protein n=1 Tax=Asparagus officinalis TaxID=4686 RepID=A0A1R3L751_ASPOF|nr:uncharacterized protein A4U43_UnF3750 [Asparagus officinalis]
MGLGEMMKTAASKALVIKINLIFLAFFLIIYVGLLLQPPSVFDPNVTPTAQCSLHACLMMKKVEAKVVGETALGQVQKKRSTTKEEIPKILKPLQGHTKIALINFAHNSTVDWDSMGQTTVVEFNKVSPYFKWKHLFPEWIDEEGEKEGTSCPEIPMPDFSAYEEADVVAARVPCRKPEEGWARDVFRLQVHLIAMNMAARRGRRDGNGRVRVLVESECRPMMEVFRCDDVVGREGRWWMFEVEGRRLEEKVVLPVGSCKLALPLWDEDTNESYNITNLPLPPPLTPPGGLRHRLHSSDAYVCGAIAPRPEPPPHEHHRRPRPPPRLLHPQPKLDALSSSGWKLSSSPASATPTPRDTPTTSTTSASSALAAHLLPQNHLHRLRHRPSSATSTSSSASRRSPPSATTASSSTRASWSSSPRPARSRP